MFETLKVPILGLVQNMSYHVCPGCTTVTHIFGADGVKRKARELGLEMIGEVPLDARVCESSDGGKPIIVSEPGGSHAKVYREMADRVWEIIK